jgi:hypothetical protein
MNRILFLLIVTIVSSSLTAQQTTSSKSKTQQSGSNKLPAKKAKSPTLTAKKSAPLSLPEQQFEKFWKTFRDNYAFFKLKGIDWDSTYKMNRPLVTKKTKEKELVSILGKMAEPLRDGHITISKEDEILFKGKTSSWFRTEFSGLENEFRAMVFKTLTKNGFDEPAHVGPVFRNEPLYYFSQSKELAYIKITRCFGTMESLFDDQLEAEDTKLMLSLFDSLLTTSKDSKALIIDMRSNGGGHGGFELASRFVRQEMITHFKSIRQPGGYDQFSVAEPIRISPNKDVQYLKPLYILTNDRTASSAEDFCISLYKQPGVKLYGTNTSGMFSDMYEAELSGSISFTLSNEMYLTTDYEVLEDTGVPVTEKIMNSKKDLQSGQDPVLSRVLQDL